MGLWGLIQLQGCLCTSSVTFKPGLWHHYSRGLNRRETLTWIIDVMDVTHAMCPEVQFYPDPVLQCRAGLGTPGFLLFAYVAYVTT